MLLAFVLCFYQFTLQIHEVDVNAKTIISFENFSQLASSAILTFAPLHLLLSLDLRHNRETGLGHKKLTEQNDTGTTRIIAYALSFIIYANAW